MNERDARDIRDAGREPVSPLSIGLWLEPPDEDAEYEAYWARSEAMRDEEREPRLCRACKRGWHPECWGCDCDCNRDEDDDG